MCRARSGHVRKNTPVALLGVIRLNAERHQALANTFVLIRVLRSQCLCQRVPQLLENNYQLLWRNALLMRFASDFPEKIREFWRWAIWPFQLLSERSPQLLHGAFREWAHGVLANSFTDPPTGGEEGGHLFLEYLDSTVDTLESGCP